MILEYSLLENGFDFLLCAINNLNIAREDTSDESARKRLLKYAMLNLSSGIELIFKHRLLEENWTYIFADMNKAKRQDLESGDFKSVDSALNIERLKNFCDISLSKKEEKTLESLRKRRNKIEHFKILESIESVEAIMCDSLSLVLTFIAQNIDLKSISEEEEELFNQIKEKTVVLEEVIEAREKVIETSAKNDGVYENLITCPKCLKRFFLSEDGEHQCLFCYYSDTPYNVADAYVTNVIGLSSYYCIKNGIEYPQYECVECGKNSFVLDFEKEKAYCFNCGLILDLDYISECAECGKPIYRAHDGYGMSLCSDCLDYKVNKDD